MDPDIRQLIKLLAEAGATAGAREFFASVYRVIQSAFAYLKRSRETKKIEDELSQEGYFWEEQTNEAVEALQVTTAELRDARQTIAELRARITELEAIIASSGLATGSGEAKGAEQDEQ